MKDLLLSMLSFAICGVCALMIQYLGVGVVGGGGGGGGSWWWGWGVGGLHCNRVSRWLRPYMDWSLMTVNLIQVCLYYFNSLWPGDRSGTVLAQVMACCLKPSGHCLGWCWLLIATDPRDHWVRDDLNLNVVKMLLLVYISLRLNETHILVLQLEISES